MLGGSCSPCCEPPFFFAGLTLSGWSGWLNGYNGGTSFNDFSRETDPYADTVALAGVFTNVLATAACNTANTFPDSRGPRCYAPVLTFTSTQVTLQLTLRYDTIGISIGGAPSFTHFVTTTTYTKQRSGFWENKYDEGIYYFTPQDVTSFTTTQPIADITNVGTAAIVQKHQASFSSRDIFSNYLAFPMRFDIVAGVSGFLGPRDFATVQNNTGAFSIVPILVVGAFGYRYLVVDNVQGTTLAGWGISAPYWEAFSSNGTMTIQNVGTDYSYLPGAGTNDIEYVPSTIIITQL